MPKPPALSDRTREAIISIARRDPDISYNELGEIFGTPVQGAYHALRMAGLASVSRRSRYVNAVRKAESKHQAALELARLVNEEDVSTAEVARRLGDSYSAVASRIQKTRTEYPGLIPLKINRALVWTPSMDYMLVDGFKNGLCKRQIAQSINAVTKQPVAKHHVTFRARKLGIIKPASPTR